MPAHLMDRTFEPVADETAIWLDLRTRRSLPAEKKQGSGLDQTRFQNGSKGNPGIEPSAIAHVEGPSVIGFGNNRLDSLPGQSDVARFAFNPDPMSVESFCDGAGCARPKEGIKHDIPRVA